MYGPDELRGRFHLHVRTDAQQAGRVEVDADVGYLGVYDAATVLAGLYPTEQRGELEAGVVAPVIGEQ